ncbi:MAG: serine hydrolase [Anaerolineae bacterium]|nr:serine hydrolase [Anaerolineae bacterium]
MTRRPSLAKRIRGLVLTLLVLGSALFLLYRLFGYHQSRAGFPFDTTIAGLEVGGLTAEEARELLHEHYLSPVAIYHHEERIELDPVDVGFNLEVDKMVGSAQEAYTNRNYWLGFATDLTGFSWRPIRVPLQAGYDRALLEEMLETIAGFLDDPPQLPQILSETAVFEEGRPGYVTDIEASLPLVEEALYRPVDRIAHLVIEDQEAPTLNFELLETVIRSKVASFDGIASIFIMDLQTGEEIRINSDLALSGMSILKIPIFVEAFRHITLPLTDYQQQIFYDTAVRSSNYGANLLLYLIAGEENAYTGADIMTESMWQLGLENTFMAIPYDPLNIPAYRRTTYETPANSRPDLPTAPDPTRQTTAEEMGALLAMIYHCAFNGGGTLMAVYPGDYTPEECQYIIDLMVLNEEGNLIRFGVPDDVLVSHKHGWILDTHGDAGIVLTPGGDYVIVEYLHYPGSWLQSDFSFPILREISRAAYNYFNFEAPYLGDRLAEEEDESGEAADEAALDEAVEDEEAEEETDFDPADQASGAGMDVVPAATAESVAGDAVEPAATPAP